MDSTMRAAVWTGAPRLEIQRVPVPIPGPGQVQIRVRAAGVCMTDIHIITGAIKYIDPPHIMGHEICGEISALGPGVRGWNVGDRVVVETSVGCGECWFCRRAMPHFCLSGGEIGFTPYQGGYAEYTCVPASNLRAIPESIGFDEGGIIESVACPVGAVYRLGLRIGDTVAVFGAGPAGLAFIQAARAAGAGKVIAVARNPARLAQAGRFGADVVVDTEKDDVDEIVLGQTKGLGVDVSFEAAGAAATVAASIRLTRKGGKVLLYGIPAESEKIAFPVFEIILKQLEIHGICNQPHAWDALIRLAASGRFNLRDMVTHRFPLEMANEAIEATVARKGGLIKAVLNP